MYTYVHTYILYSKSNKVWFSLGHNAAWSPCDRQSGFGGLVDHAGCCDTILHTRAREVALASVQLFTFSECKKLQTRAQVAAQAFVSTTCPSQPKFWWRARARA